jgi:hypothetical protein
LKPISLLPNNPLNSLYPKKSNPTPPPNQKAPKLMNTTPNTKIQRDLKLSAKLLKMKLNPFFGVFNGGIKKCVKYNSKMVEK